MKPKWTVAKARGRFAELLDAVAREPQVIFNRDERVAVLVDAATFDEFEAWRALLRNRALPDSPQGSSGRQVSRDPA